MFSILISHLQSFEYLCKAVQIRTHAVQVQYASILAYKSSSWYLIKFTANIPYNAGYAAAFNRGAQHCPVSIESKRPSTEILIFGAVHLK